MQPKKVLLVIAHEGYQPVEYGTPKKLLEEAGFTVVTASDQSGVARATDESETEVDLVLSTVKVGDYDGIFFIGGAGCLEHLDNQTSYHVIQNAVQEGKIIGGICAAARILAKAGVLEGKYATGWDGDGELGTVYKEHLVQYKAEDVVIDGPIITADGPASAQKFGQGCILLLQGQRSWG